MENINQQLSKDLELELQHSRNVIKDFNIVMWEWDIEQDRWRAFSNTLNLSGSSKTWKNRVHPIDLKLALQAYCNYINKSSSEYKCEYRFKLKDDRYTWVQSSGTAVWDDMEKPIYISGYLIDISERKEMEEKIKYLAYYDNLSGLPNRNMLQYKLKSEIASMAYDNANHILAVICIELDDFKAINDIKGHSFGDNVLKQVSTRLKRLLGKNYILARTGGVEFVFIISHMTGREEAVNIIETIMNQFKSPIKIEDEEINLSISAGIAMYPEHGKDDQSLLGNADAALYFVKKAGKNNYKFYNEQMNSDISTRLELEKRLRDAVNNEEFVVYYQPQIKVDSEELIGMEALVRWIHPVKGIIPPADFINLAEETGLIVPIGEFVLRTACKQNKYWQEAGLKPVRVSVNLSARQFSKQNLVKLITDILEETGMEPKWLEVEITESIAMENLESTIDTLKQLRDLGVHIALDDFGTGYSSLNYLRKLPIDTLKIDKSFIDKVDQNDDDRVITKTIISLSQSMRLDIVAEGVENDEQFSFLRENNCDKVQGYLFSKPLSAEEFEKYISNCGLDHKTR